jgi:site-specific DNA-methyltransferase (adenine-specific)
LPPSFDGNTRAPLPRFTALDGKDRKKMSVFFKEWANLCFHALCPGAHVFVASNAFIVPVLMASLSAGGLEFRGQIIREVRTLRGGDRPKNAER